MRSHNRPQNEARSTIKDRLPRQYISGKPAVPKCAAQGLTQLPLGRLDRGHQLGLHILRQLRGQPKALPKLRLHHPGQLGGVLRALLLRILRQQQRWQE